MCSLCKHRVVKLLVIRVCDELGEHSVVFSIHYNPEQDAKDLRI